MGALRGRVGSIAPELLEGHPHPANGVWSVGALLWELLTGAPLFAGRSIREASAAVRQADLTPAFDQVGQSHPAFAPLLRRTLVRDPDARPQATELAADLARISAELG